MEIKIIANPKPTYMELYIDGISYPLLNALRRAIITEVPTLAVHDVIVHMNTSVLYDEEIALRLALIPLTVDPQDIDVLGKCRNLEKMDLSELVDCTARLRLRKKNTFKDKIITVYSRELEPIDKKSVRPVYDDIPIVKLGPGQEIDVEIIAKVGKGKDHAKWIPVSTLGYKPLPILKIKDTSKCINCDVCIDACPKKLLRKINGEPVLDGLGIYHCDLDKICVRACPEEVLELVESESQFIFRIESVGQHSAIDIIKTAIDILNEKYLDLSKELQNKIREFKEV